MNRLALSPNAASRASPNQALEQTRDSVLRYGERVGCELLNFFVPPCTSSPCASVPLGRRATDTQRSLARLACRMLALREAKCRFEFPPMQGAG